MIFERPQLVLPNEADRLLLHSCCAPCSGEVMEALLASDIDFSIFFYNPNIHPVQEYELRKEENVIFAQKQETYIPIVSVHLIDIDYHKAPFFGRCPTSTKYDVRIIYI